MGPLIDLARIPASDWIEVLYKVFHDDFVGAKTHLNGVIWINPESHRKDDGKELSFWHLTTRKQQNGFDKNGRPFFERLVDTRRSERLGWIKLIIENHNSPSVRLFYHKESNAKGDIRLYLWAHREDFVVILQKLGKSSSFLVTSFYVDHQAKKSDFTKRYEAYVAGTNPDVRGVQWF